MKNKQCTQRTVSFVFVISLAISATLLSTGCKDKAAEDTAAIRSMMEAQKTSSELQKKRAAEEFAAGKAALAKE